jgi:DNA-binding MarR family transcriptional regulator
MFRRKRTTGVYIDPEFFRGEFRGDEVMREMFYNLIRAKQAKAIMLHLHGTDKELSISEYAVLRALAERMAQKTLPRQGRCTQTIANTCFPGLDSIARDAAMCEKTVRRAIKSLEKKNLIAKEVIHNWQWRGRKDYTPQHDGVRYRCTKIWDEVPVVEYGVDYDEADIDEQEHTEVSAEELAETDCVLDDDLPVATKCTDGTEPTNADIDEVIRVIKHYFADHPSITKLTDNDPIQPTCKDLAQRALALGDIKYADAFIWWMINRRSSIYDYLMSEKVHNLCVHFGLPKYIKELWDRFVAEKDDEITDGDAQQQEEYADTESELEVEDDYEEPVKAPAPKAAVKVHEFEGDEDDDIPTDPVTAAPAASVEEKLVNPYRYHRDIFAKVLLKDEELLRRPSESFTINLDTSDDITLGWVHKWLDAVPYDRQIVHQRVSQSLLRVEIKWNAARYIAEHVDQFVEDGYVEAQYKPVIDPDVLAEIEAEKAAAEEAVRELARKQAQEAEAAEIQRKADAAVTEAQRKQKNREYNCRRFLLDGTNTETGSFSYLASSPDTIHVLADCVATNYPDTFKIVNKSESLIEGTVSGSLLHIITVDPINFRQTGALVVEPEAAAA